MREQFSSERFKQWLSSSGFTIKGFARMANVSPSTIWAAKENRKVSQKTLRKIIRQTNKFFL